jgi:hypothetical protein
MSIGTSAQLTQYEIAFDIDLLRELERTIQISARLHQRQAELPAPQRWWRYASLSKLLLSVWTVPCDRSIGDMTLIAGYRSINSMATAKIRSDY